MRLRKDRRGNKNKFLKPFFLIFPFVIILFAIYVIFYSNLLNIQIVDVDFSQVNCASSKQIKDAAQVEKQNLLFIDLTNIERQIKQKFVCVKGVSFTKIFPNKVIIHTSGRQPAALLLPYKAIESSSSGEIATPSASISTSSGEIVDDEGVIFDRSNTNVSLLKIYIDDQNANLKQAMYVINKIKNFIEIKQVWISKNNLFINTDFILVIPLIEKVDEKLAALQLILDKSKIGEEKVEKIDLRFENPVIKYGSKTR